MLNLVSRSRFSKNIRVGQLGTLLTSAEWAGDTLFMYPFTGGAFTVISFQIAVIF